MSRPADSSACRVASVFSSRRLFSVGFGFMRPLYGLTQTQCTNITYTTYITYYMYPTDTSDCLDERSDAHGRQANVRTGAGTGGRQEPAGCTGRDQAVSRRHG